MKTKLLLLIAIIFVSCTLFAQNNIPIHPVDMDPIVIQKGAFDKCSGDTSRSFTLSFHCDCVGSLQNSFWGHYFIDGSDCPNTKKLKNEAIASLYKTIEHAKAEDISIYYEGSSFTADSVVKIVAMGVTIWENNE